MKPFAVDVEHPHRGRIVRTTVTVDANNFDHAVQKALGPFPDPKRVMTVCWEITPPEPENDLFEGKQ